jgi:transcriptional regulator with XRE-family HTH domain
MQTIGEQLKELRENNGFLLRDVAEALEVDSSFLSKIEHGIKRPTRVQIIKLAEFFKINAEDLLITYLSDKVAYELREEEQPNKIMRVAEKKIAYLNRNQK